MSPKRACAESQKPRIVQSFYETIREEGFENSSIAKVAQRIGIHPSLILHYFGNKENMTLELVEFVVQQYSDVFRGIRKRQKTMDPNRRMAMFFQAIWSESYHATIDIAASLSVLSVSLRNKRVQKKVKWLYEQLRLVLVKELTLWVEQGWIPAQDVGRTAAVVMSMIEGSRYFRRFFVKVKELPRYNRDMAVAALTLVRNRSWQEKV